MVRSLTLPKVVAVVFGLFALIAISASSGSKADFRRASVQEEAKVLPQEVVAEEKHAVQEQPQVAVQQQEKAVVEQQLPNKDVHVHVYVHTEQEKIQSTTAEDAVKMNSHQSSDAVKQMMDCPCDHQGMPHGRGMAHGMQHGEHGMPHGMHHPNNTAMDCPCKNMTAAAGVPSTAEPVEAPAKVAVKAAVAQRTVKSTSVPAAVLVIPMVALAAALVAVKYRKPGYLPEVFEERLEAAGLPAAGRSPTRAGFNSWTGSSRSMYGSV